jgi:hypothetical protein
MVRAKVAAIRAGQVEGAARADTLAECARYLALAAAQIQPPAPALLIASGLSGAGKTSQSQPLVEGCGVIRVRADVERKRLFGLDADARSGSTLGGGLYSAQASARTYARLASWRARWSRPATRCWSMPPSSSVRSARPLPSWRRRSACRSPSSPSMRRSRPCALACASGRGGRGRLRGRRRRAGNAT